MGNGQVGQGDRVLRGARRVERTFTVLDLRAVEEHDRAVVRGRTGARSCARKRSLGQRRAHLEARLLREKGEQVHAYPCNRCRQWHVGHAPAAAPVAASAGCRPR